MINGVDLSQYQGQPNFDSLKGAIQFAIIKATYGNGYTDPQFIRNQSEARRVGLLLGYYHYSYPEYNTATDEANWMLSIIKNIQDGEIIFLDFEENYKGDVVAWCKEFLDTISKALGGYKPLVYLNLSEIKGANWQPIIDAGYGLWLADYDNVSNNAPDTPWPIVAFKQWEDNAQIPGISGNVDADVLFGDENTFKTYGYHAIVTQQSTQGPVNTTYQTTTINDQTKINIGPDSHGYDWGTLQVGTIRSTLGDQKNTINIQGAQVTALNDQITTLTAQLKVQTPPNTVSAVSPSVPPTTVLPTQNYTFAPWVPGWLKGLLGE